MLPWQYNTSPIFTSASNIYITDDGNSLKRDIDTYFKAQMILQLKWAKYILGVSKQKGMQVFQFDLLKKQLQP